MHTRPARLRAYLPVCLLTRLRTSLPSCLRGSKRSLHAATASPAMVGKCCGGGGGGAMSPCRFAAACASYGQPPSNSHQAAHCHETCDTRRLIESTGNPPGTRCKHRELHHGVPIRFSTITTKQQLSVPSSYTEGDI